MDRLLTKDEVAQILGIPPKAVQALCRTGQLSYVQVTPRVRKFASEHVQAFIDGRTISQRAAVDKTLPKPLPCDRKGGESAKSFGGKEKGLSEIRKEIEALCPS